MKTHPDPTLHDKILHIIHYDNCRGLWGDAVRLAAESLGICDVFWNILIPLAEDSLHIQP